MQAISRQSVAVMLRVIGWVSLMRLRSEAAAALIFELFGTQRAVRIWTVRGASSRRLSVRETNRRRVLLTCLPNARLHMSTASSVA